MTEAPTQPTFDDLRTPTKLAEENPDLLTKGQVNHLIKNRHYNGLAESGAVLKISRKIYINRSLFIDWFIQQKAS